MTLPFPSVGFQKGGRPQAVIEECRAGDGSGHVLIMAVGRQRYAVRVSDVVEILRAVAVVPLPTAPPVVLGVMDLRGALVPVLDLGVRFGLPPRPVSPDEHFVVLRRPGRVVALRVDAAQGLRLLGEGQVHPVSNIVPSAEFVQGLAPLPDGILLIADAQAFLSEAESLTIGELLACGGAPPVTA
jgi:purine-binding chemotaxis protein CheW